MVSTTVQMLIRYAAYTLHGLVETVAVAQLEIMPPGLCQAWNTQLGS